MIDQENYEAMKSNSAKLLRENTKLHAEIKHYKEANVGIKNAAEKALREMAHIYDTSNEKVLKWFEKWYGKGERYREIMSIMPLKLGSKND